MNNLISSKKLKILFLIGILGAIILMSSDYLMIYGDPSFEGEIAWLTTGVANVSAKRNALAMLMAFISIGFYAIGVFAVRYFFKDAKGRMHYVALSAFSLTPWLCLHLFFVMIMFSFATLMNMNETSLAYDLCTKMYNQYAWLIILADIIMILPYLYLFIMILKQKLVLPKIMALNNPIIIFVILKLMTMLMPESAFKLAFTNGLMSEAMIIWFIIYLVYISIKCKKVN